MWAICCLETTRVNAYKVCAYVFYAQLVLLFIVRNNSMILFSLEIFVVLLLWLHHLLVTLLTAIVFNLRAAYGSSETSFFFFSPSTLDYLHCVQDRFLHGAYIGMCVCKGGVEEGAEWLKLFKNGLVLPSFSEFAGQGSVQPLKLPTHYWIPQSCQPFLILQ